MWQHPVCNFAVMFAVMRQSGLSIALYLQNKLHSLRRSKQLPGGRVIFTYATL